MKPKSPRNIEGTPHLPEDRDDELSEAEVERTAPIAKLFGDKAKAHAQKNIRDVVDGRRVRNPNPSGKKWITYSGGTRA